MKKLKESDIVQVMREEWAIKVAALNEKLDLSLNAKVKGEKDPQPILTPDLKVLHKKSGIRYTIVSVGPRDVILKTPEGENFLVDADEIEQNYILD